MEKQESAITDIFLWANNVDAYKDQIDIELFLFNKNYTPYSMPISGDLDKQLRPLFLYDYINFVNLGAGTGLTVHDYEMSESGENILLRTNLDNVGRAETLIHLIENERGDIVEFSETEHEFKRIKGVLARFTKDEQVFYTAKLISQGQVLNNSLAWELVDGKFNHFRGEVGFKMPDDNQVLIVGNDVFAFNASKFERMFGYNYKKQLIADQKIDEINKCYQLVFSDGLDMNSLVAENKTIVNKLQKVEVGVINQEQVIDYADAMQLPLMSDNNNAIIITDRHDLNTFVNLINEDYVESNISGRRYEIKSKKILGEPEGEAPRN